MTTNNNEITFRGSAPLKKNLRNHQRTKNAHRFRSAKAKQMFSLCRWLHIYISCALFSLLLFFCITGITLNHPTWAGKPVIDHQTRQLPPNMVMNADGEFNIKAIQRFIEKDIGLSNPRNIDIALDIGEITYDYPLSSGYAFVTVFLEDNSFEIEQANQGLLTLLNNLHKGRHSGKVWAWLIDISAALMALFTLTGLIILLQNAKHRRKALYILLLGSMTPIALYLLFVPQLILY